MSNAEGPPHDATAPPRVVFLGMPCAFSAPPLAALIAAGIDVAAVVLPGPPQGEALRWQQPAVPRRPAIPLGVPSTTGDASLMTIAHAAGIPLLFVAAIGSTAAVAEIARLEPDAIAVACYPERLPAALLAVPPLGALNVHPSLLPRDRGPSPLFWAFHRGADETGVTVHLMEETLDTGPIVRQVRARIAEGVRHSELEGELAHLGGALLVQAVRARAAGDLSATLQDHTAATAASFPTPQDAVVDPATWSAERALRFVRGMRSATLRLPNGDLEPVIDAVRWRPPMTPDSPSSFEASGLVVPFVEGRITFQLAPGARTDRPR